MNVASEVKYLSNDKDFSHISLAECSKLSNHASVDSVWKIICDRLIMSDILHPNSEIYAQLEKYRFTNLTKVTIHWNGLIRSLSEIILELSQLNNTEDTTIEHYISDIRITNDGNIIQFNETMYGQIFERAVVLIDRKKTKLKNWSPKIRKSYGELLNGDITIIGTNAHDDGYIIINATGEIYDRDKGIQNNFLRKCAVIGVGIAAIIGSIFVGLSQY